jgi:tRNA threonylcarbamoyladenosine biosynthesis protein TsaE
MTVNRTLFKSPPTAMALFVGGCGGVVTAIEDARAGMGGGERQFVVALHLPDEKATVSLANRIAPLALPGDVLALWGGLGTGKTVFARAFVRGRGASEEEVPSPTFTLLQTYDPGPGFVGAVYHFDLFRLTAAEEAYELDIEEAFADGVSLIEWPGRLGRLLPAVRLDITLAQGSAANSRRVTLEGHGSWAARLKEIGLG